MALYKAKASFKTAKNKYFGIHTIKELEKGASIEITDINTVPKSVQGHLELAKIKKKKGDK